MRALRRALFGVGLGLVLAVAALLAWQWLGLGRSSFEAEGRVTGFANDGATVYIEHGAVEGFREAAASPFRVESRAMTDSLKVGDAVRIRFSAGRGQPQITDLQTLLDNALPKNPVGKKAENTSGKSSAALKVGEEVPDISLVTQSGNEIHLSDFRGQALFLTFIYTECPLPDFCPLMSKQFAALQPKLGEAFGKKAHLLSISFDPENDTPPVLSAYGHRYTDDFSTWTFATPTSNEELEEAKEAFRVTMRKKKGEIMHNLVTALISPHGRLVWKWRGNDWVAEDLLEVGRETLKDDALTEARAEK